MVVPDATIVVHQGIPVATIVVNSNVIHIL
jgi:hypothetical protein